MYINTTLLFKFFENVLKIVHFDIRKKYVNGCNQITFVNCETIKAEIGMGISISTVTKFANIL